MRPQYTLARGLPVSCACRYIVAGLEFLKKTVQIHEDSQITTTFLLVKEILPWRVNVRPC